MNIAKITSSVAVYLVGTTYRLQWLMRTPLSVLNEFYSTLTLHLLHIVRLQIFFSRVYIVKLIFSFNSLIFSFSRLGAILLAVILMH